MKVEVDIDEVAKAEIARLKKEVASLERKLGRVAHERDELRRTKGEVQTALANIKDFASSLPNYDW